MRLKYLLNILLISCCVSTAGNTSAQTTDIIQIDGVTMTADSLRAVPDATIMVKNKNRGTESEYTGVFSIVCAKGDTLIFSCLGFRPKEYVISKDIKGQIFSMIQLMVQDTFYLPETIIK